jgi:hypothetical protein
MSRSQSPKAAGRSTVHLHHQLFFTSLSGVASAILAVL